MKRAESIVGNINQTVAQERLFLNEKLTNIQNIVVGSAEIIKNTIKTDFCPQYGPGGPYHDKLSNLGKVELSFLCSSVSKI
jgi:hypothetical protein